jgi:hypothetical protein
MQMGIFQIQAITVNKPATGRGLDLKMEIFQTVWYSLLLEN